MEYRESADNENENVSREMSSDAVLKRRAYLILRYKEMQRVKKGVVSKNFKYFIKK